jgi:sialate O-acetylesterase
MFNNIRQKARALSVAALLFGTYISNAVEDAQELSVHSMYSDHMVLQADAPIHIRGKAAAGTSVSVSIDGNTISTQATANGSWEAILPAMTYGGPYRISIESGLQKISFRDVLIGEVWLCSGQSNMGVQLAGSLNGAEEMLQSKNYPQLRLFKVNPSFNLNREQSEVDTTNGWQVAGPWSSSRFSAVAYHFGKQLNTDLNVPIGIIESCWGGTAIESWISRPTFRRWGYKRTVEKIDQTAKTALAKKSEDHQLKVEYEQAFDTWVASFYSQAEANQQVSEWKPLQLPAELTGEKWDDFDGLFSIRRTVSIPADFAGHELELRIGAIDDCDETYFNGERIGQTDHRVPNCWVAPRTYTVPAHLVKAGHNTIEIKITDFSGGTAIVGEMLLEQKTTEQTIPLYGEWDYRIEAAVDLATLEKRPNLARPSGYNTPSAIYNAMIAPWTSIPMRGFTWYQGEANSWHPKAYMRLLPQLINSWRTAWNDDEMGFMIAQLAAYETDRPEKIEDFEHYYEKRKAVTHGWGDAGWGPIREVQAAALALPHTGMAVTIDVGNPADIHPKNKEAVGYRLALEAERVIYQRDIVSCGPIYKSQSIRDQAIHLHFDHIGSGLVSSDGKDLSQFAIAGADGHFVWAEATISGDSVIVSSPDILDPKHVRYAWASYPDGANLTNKEGFPAAPFRTDQPDYLISNEFPDSK